MLFAEPATGDMEGARGQPEHAPELAGAVIGRERRRGCNVAGAAAVTHAFASVLSAYYCEYVLSKIAA